VLADITEFRISEMGTQMICQLPEVLVESNSDQGTLIKPPESWLACVSHNGNRVRGVAALPLFEAVHPPP
jgi:hypothetical protein